MAFFIILLAGIAWTAVAVSRAGWKKFTWGMWLVLMLGLVGTVNWITGRL